MSVEPMRKTKDEMAADYDLAGKKGVRGKYAKAVTSGYSVKKFNGSKLVADQYFASIAPDVREYFPDSRSINIALRKLITLVPHKTSR